MNNTNTSPMKISTLKQVGIPFALRRDGLADTYLGDGGLYLLPMSNHDYALTALLEAKNLSVAKLIGTDDGRQLIHYGKNVELVSFSALLSSSIDEEEGQRQITDAIQRLTILLQSIVNLTGKLPQIDHTDDIAIDRWSGSIELIAPFTLSSDVTIPELIERLENSAYAMFEGDTVNKDTVYNVFLDAKEEPGHE